MDKKNELILNKARRIYKKIDVFSPPRKNEWDLFVPKNGTPLTIDSQDQEAGSLIKDQLANSSPCMISRLGRTELRAILIYRTMQENPNIYSKIIKYIRGDIGYFWWNDFIKDKMQVNSGFFPSDEVMLDKFCKRMLSDIRNINILGSWLDGESCLTSFLKQAKAVPLIDLEPYHHETPWSMALENKKVLVVHPFDKSIQQQYLKRELLFEDPRVLPDFELLTLKAIQSVNGHHEDFESWFEALDWMCEKISNIDFDIAIIGAGAYGLPLASFVKNIGKKAIHLGGAVQILFGIRGARWDKWPRYQNLYNSDWVRPLSTETPGNLSRICDRGAYW
ncbi:MAG: hypothetical protein AAF329_07365 [Cyanobacteria bacterium P01_A01_bin.17]